MSQVVEDAIRKRAVSVMIYIEGLLRERRNCAEKEMWLVLNDTKPLIINYRPDTERLICRLSRQDISQGFTSQKWNNVLLTLIEYLTKYNDEGGDVSQMV